MSMPVPSLAVNQWEQQEDEALKQKLSGFSVINPAGGFQVPVQVFYRLPDAEEVTRTFPHISIDLVDIVFAPERAHRALEYIIPYTLEQATPTVNETYVGDDYPLPWSLVYQVTAFSRQPRHDRQLLMMLYQMFPEEYGSLDMTNIDGTVRRCDLVDVTRRDTVDSTNKRLYRAIFTVEVSTEFFVNQLRLTPQALQSVITYVQYTNQPAVPGGRTQ